jgi:YbbR domain-containing protein
MKERKFPIILISLVFSLLVWASVNLGNVFKTTIEVPVKVENLRPDQAIAVPLPHTVRFTIQGSGWQLLNTLLTPNLYYTIDFSTLPRNNFLFTSRELNERVNLAGSIRVLATSPETVIVRLDERISKIIPVTPMLNITFREGFGIVGDVAVAPDSITITGARSLLSKIQEWKTKPFSVHDINAPYSMQFILSDTLGFEIARPDSPVLVKFDVQPIAERTIEDIPIEILQVPENRNIVLIPPKLSIIVRSGVNNVSNLSQKDFQASIDYKSILLDTSGLLRATIIGPDHVKIVQQNPELIQYVMRK